jgi:ABC-type amino acid transport substrate-binding protein
MCKKTFSLALFLFIISGVLASAGTVPPKIRVGYVFSPPYLINKNGKRSGVCFDLWKLVSDSLRINSEMVYYASHDSLLNDLRTGKIDLSICPYTATTDRLHHFRLSIPFHISNMGIVSRAENHRPIIQTIRHIFSWEVLRWLVMVLIIVSVFAFFLWLAERKSNSLQFHPSAKGVLDGIWWAFVTMTTVGYGDKIPKTNVGKILAIAWMFFAIGLFFVASGVISSELTLNKLQSRIQSSNDLTHCRVGAVSGSGYAETLNNQGINPILYNTPWDGYTALESEAIDALVDDLALLKYIVAFHKKENTLVVIPSGLNLQYFSFMISKNNANLTDQLNTALLSAIDSDSWEEILARYGLENK